MSQLRERMIEDMILAGLALGDATGVHSGGAPAGRALPALTRSTQRRGSTQLPARVAPTGRGTRDVQDWPVRPPLPVPAHTPP
jgi:hypothetical protein